MIENSDGGVGHSLPSQVGRSDTSSNDDSDNNNVWSNSSFRNLKAALTPRTITRMYSTAADAIQAPIGGWYACQWVSLYFVMTLFIVFLAVVAECIAFGGECSFQGINDTRVNPN